MGLSNCIFEIYNIMRNSIWRKMLVNMGGDIRFILIHPPKKFLSTGFKQKGDFSRMYGIAALASLWLIPDISPDAGMLRSGSPSNKNRSKQSKSTQIRVSGRSPPLPQKRVGFCRGNLGFTRWVRCDWANCSRAGILGLISLSATWWANTSWAFEAFGWSASYPKVGSARRRYI